MQAGILVPSHTAGNSLTEAGRLVEEKSTQKERLHEKEVVTVARRHVVAGAGQGRGRGGQQAAKTRGVSRCCSWLEEIAAVGTTPDQAGHEVLGQRDTIRAYTRWWLARLVRRQKDNIERVAKGP